MKVAHARLHALLSLWEQKRGTRLMPARADLAVGALRPWLGNLALIEKPGAADARFRLCGTSLYRRFRRELTGCSLASLSDEELGNLTEITSRAKSTRKPVQSKYVRDDIVREAVFHEICLPLSDDGTDVNTILFASYEEAQQ